MAIALSLLVLISMIDGSIACPASEIAAAGARDAAEQLICEDNDGISTTVRAQVAGIAYPMNDTITLNVPGRVDHRILLVNLCMWRRADRWKPDRCTIGIQHVQGLIQHRTCDDGKRVATDVSRAWHKTRVDFIDS